MRGLIQSFTARNSVYHTQLMVTVVTLPSCRKFFFCISDEFIEMASVNTSFSHASQPLTGDIAWF